MITDDIRKQIEQAAKIAATEPNSAKTFQRVVRYLEQLPGLDQQQAAAIAAGVLPGSYRAFQKQNSEREARLMAAVRRGGII